jgi:ABC-2 type transport system permease protein
MKLYIRFFIIHLKSQMQYKASFFMTVAGQFLLSFSAFLGVYFMFERFGSVEGFEFSEVLLCFAVVLIAFSFAECFARGFDTFATVIGNGEFDRAMTRPRNEIFLVLASRMELTRIGRLIQAIVILAYAIPASGVVWSADKILLLVLMIASGAVIFSGLFIIYAAICFFTTQGLEFMNIFTDGGREFGRYPFVVYGKGVLRFFTYIIPLALFQYYPLLYLTGKSENMLLMLLPPAGCLFIVPCLAFWRVGIRHYKSTGS